LYEVEAHMLAAPAFLLGATVATLWAGLYHVLRGRRAVEALLVWAIALAGFGLGQLVGNAADAHLLRYGQVQLLFGSLGSWLGLLIAHLLRLC
jgi:hypothetical protein